MSCPRLALPLLVLSLLLPVRGWAQTPPPLVPVSPSQAPDTPGTRAPEAENPPQGEIIPRQAVASEGSNLRVPRILLEVLGGQVLGLIAGGPGIAIFAIESFCESCDNTPQIIGGISLAAVGLTLGSAVGIKAMGSLLGGEGRFLTTLKGSALIGGLVGRF